MFDENSLERWAHIELCRPFLIIGKKLNFSFPRGNQLKSFKWQNGIGMHIWNSSTQEAETREFCVSG